MGTNISGVHRSTRHTTKGVVQDSTRGGTGARTERAISGAKFITYVVFIFSTTLCSLPLLSLDYKLEGGT